MLKNVEQEDRESALLGWTKRGKRIERAEWKNNISEKNGHASMPLTEKDMSPHFLLVILDNILVNYY